MESSMMELLFGKEALERAKKRGRAYMCVACHNLTGERRTGELGPMQDHVLKTHVSRDRVPFYCRLCTFKCQTRSQMDHHTRHYSRHVTMAKFRGITNHEEWQIQSPAPYQIGEKDLLKFSQEESTIFFLGKQSPGAVPMQETLGQMDLAVPGNPEEDLSSETLQQGYISIPEDPVDLSSGVQPMQGQGTSVGQWISQPSLVGPNFAPVRQETRGLAHQVRALPRLPLPLQINSLVNSGLQRSFSSVTQNGMTQEAVMTRTPPGSYHPSPMPSPGFQSPEPSTSQLGTNQAAVTAQCRQPALQPPVVLTVPLAKHVGTSPAMAVHPVNPPTRLVMASAMQSGTAVSVPPSPVVSLVSVAGTSARTQEIEEKMAAQCPQLPPQQQVASLPQVANQISVSDAMTTFPTSTMSAQTEVVQPSTVASGFPSPSLAGADDVGGSLDPLQAAGVSEPVSEQFPPEEPAAKEGATEEVENLWPQLMPQEDSDQLSEVESQYSAEGLKRKTAERKGDKIDMDQAKDDLDDGQADVEPNPKKQRTDRAAPVFEISMVALNGLTSSIQRLTGEVTRTRDNHEKTEKALLEVTCALSKCTDAINRFKNVLEENAKEERRREERWMEMDRAREEERRKDREAEQRREVRRREAERKDREELRKLLAEMKEETKSRQKGDKVRDGEEKENSKSLKSVLGKSYTENSIKDLSKRK